MAALFIEGFDKYGPPTTTINTAVGTLLTQGEWTVIAQAQIVAPLSATGYALAHSDYTNTFSKTLATSYSRLIGGVRFSTPLTGSAGISLADSNTAQFTIVINQTTGLISAITGGMAGTVLATSSTSVTANTTHYLEWDVTFGTSAAYQVWLDGVSIISGTGATKTSSNNSANQFQFVSGLNITWTVDDLYIFDTTTSFNNAVLLTNPRIETQFPISDYQTQFTNVGTIIGQPYSATTNTDTPGANYLFLRRFASSVAQTINSVSLIAHTTNASANFEAVIYSDSSGSPHTLLSSGTQVTGTTSGSALTGNLTTPQSLTAGTYYWIGFIGDTAIALLEVDATATGQKASNTYSSGAPSTAPSMTTAQASWVLWGNCTGGVTNWEAVDNNPAPGSISSIQSSTVDNEDLYNFPGLTTNPQHIYTMAVKANAKRSDSGARTIDLRVLSGSTDSGGSDTGQTPATSYVWCDSLFDTDPATGAAWTTAGVNGAQSGPKVSS